MQDQGAGLGHRPDLTRYGVSRNTVQLTIGLLANEGTIASTPGGGTFVRNSTVISYHAS